MILSCKTENGYVDLDIEYNGKKFTLVRFNEKILDEGHFTAIHIDPPVKENE